MRRSLRQAVFALFLLSGISGLIYEVVWVRMLVTIFGNTTFAVSTVLSAYMTGLAIGSYAFGRLIDRRGGKALLIYALLQTGVAVSAVLLTMALWNVTPVLVWVQRALSESAVHLAVVRYLIVFSLLVVPTTLMGGTLPVLSKFLVERRSSLGRYVGVLYALNTLGAALGCFAAGFLLIGRLGLDLTVWSAAALNLGIGAVSWALARRRGVATGGLSVAERAASPIGSSGLPGPEETGGGDGGPSLRTLVLFAMAFSGFAALGYEVIWTKALIFSLGNSVYAFATMLTTFLIGLALGSLFCSWLVDRGKRLMAGLGVVEAGIGVYGILCVHLFASLIKPSSSEVTAATAGPSPLVGTGFLDTFWVMLLPTLLMGATFPLAVRICTVTVGRVGRGTGSVYSFNTVGSVLGSTVTGFVLLPLLGLQRGLIALGLVNVTVGLLLCAVEPRMRRGTKVIVLGALVGALLTALWTTPENVFRRAFEQGTKFVYYKEDVSGVVWVQEDGPDRSLFIDRRDMAGTYGRLFDSQRALGHLPLLLHPNPRRVFVLGFGAGGACYSIGTHPEVERLDAAEICPPVLEAAEFLTRISRGILDDPRFHLYLNDGRNFLLTARGSYDVISVDLLYPDAAGTGSLYTREFYETCSRRLADDGLMVEWLPLHLISSRDLKVIVRTCQSVFPHVSLWHSPYYTCLLMVGSKKELRVDFQRLVERMARPAVRDDLSEVHLTSAYGLVGYFAASDEALAACTADVDLLNTDDLPVIEYSAPRTRNDELVTRRILLDVQPDVLALLTDLGETPEESGRVRARLLAAHQSNRSVQRAIVALRKGRFIHPLFRSASDRSAVSYCLKAQVLDPTNELASLFLGEAHWFLGATLESEGRLGEALEHKLRGLRLWPDIARLPILEYRKTLAANPGSARTHFDLAVALAGTGETGEAIQHLGTALRLQPDLPGAASLLSKLQAASGPASTRP